MSEALIVSSTPQVRNCNWSRKTLRKCLAALGVTDKEMRYRLGAKSILQSWTGEVDELKKLAHAKWRTQVVKHHEANGGDPEQWKIWNTIYSTTLKKLAPYLTTGNKRKPR